jgi:DMSO/TMAO reductase YedYZ molybdopterin-dependent catalytic subunit
MSTGRRNFDGTLAGIAAAAAALGVAELVSVITGPQSAPLVAVGGVVIDGVPKAGKDLAVQLFGTHDKQALLTGTTILLAVFAALIGIAARHRADYGYLGIGLFGLLGLVAAVTRPGAGPGSVLPAILGAVAGGAVLWLLLRYLPPASGPGPAMVPVTTEDGSPGTTASGSPGTAASGWPEPAAGGLGLANRRYFLRGATISIIGGLVVGYVGRTLAERRNVNGARNRLSLPSASAPAPAVPSGADLGIAGLSPYVTSNADFYRIDTALVVPQVDPATWTLKIHGKVRRPMTLTFDQLLQRPTIERYVTLTCVSNEVGGDLISNARWLGVPLKDLIDEVQPDPDADQVVSRSVDDFTAGTPTRALRDGRDAMIAIAMNGEPLPLVHGFPARMVVPGLYGYVSATKWLAELEFSTFGSFDAYWVRRGWAAQAPIKTESRIDTPRGPVKPGPVMVAGVAWAQHRGISAVEVRVDGGGWQPATLAATLSVDTWRQWYWSWQATPGDHTLQVRATDNAGAVQTQVQAPPDPDGATGYHTIEVTVG